MTASLLLGLLLVFLPGLSGCGGSVPDLGEGGCVAEEGEAGEGAALRIDVGAGESEEEGEESEEEGEESEAGGVASGFVEDGPYSEERGYGWLGEAETARRESWYVEVFTVGTSGAGNPGEDADAYGEAVAPYLTWVEGLTGYRVDVADGLWRVTLHFLEPSYPEPGLRIFDVTTGEGTRIIEDLDLAAVAGQDEQVAITVNVRARNGSLELSFSAETDALPVLSALELEPASSGEAAAVQELEARGGAGEGLVRWGDDPALRGWWVERSRWGLDWHAVDDPLRVAPYLVDRGVNPGDRWQWRVWPVHPDCSLGDPARTEAVTVPTQASFGLPVVDVTVDPESFAGIHREPEQDVEVPATVAVGGERATGTIRLRGQSTRYLSRRSYRIAFDEGTIDGRDRLKLLAELPDPTRLWQLLAYDLLDRAGALAPRARPVLLRINGENRGVYDDVEHVGDLFFADRGYPEHGDRFRLRAANFALEYDESGDIDLSDYEKKENEGDPSPELESLLVWLNQAAEDEVASDPAAWVDTEVLLDYLAVQSLIANYEVVDGGHYLAWDTDAERFLLIPWDLNNETWNRSELSLVHLSFFDLGAEPDSWSADWLRSRFLAEDAFRHDLADRLETLLEGPFGEEMDAAVTDTWNTVQPALAVEPWIWRRRYESWLAQGPEEIATFVEERREVISAGLDDLRARGEEDLVIVEVQPDSARVVVENRGQEARDLSACYVTPDPYTPLAGSLADAGFVEPGDAVTLEGSALELHADGGYLGLGCFTEGQEEESFEVFSYLVYPALAAGETYRRSSGNWRVDAR